MIFKLISIVFLLALTYFPVFLWMFDRWFSRDSYYSHGILIPFLVIFFIWQKRSKIINQPFIASVWGNRLFLIGVGIHLLSLIAGVYFTSAFSLVIVLLGLVLQLYGRQVFKELYLPLLFLVLMIPLPLVFIVNLSFQLKLLAAKLAAIMLHQLGIPAISEGSYIQMRNAFVVVEDVCSGLRSLMALISLGAVFAYLMKTSYKKKLVLLLAAFPIAIIVNALRIAVLALKAEWWGVESIQGIVHEVAGYLVIAVACLMFYLIKELMG